MPQTLQDVKQQIIDDKVCPDLAKQATQLVFGDGDPKSDIVFIGEAPGKNEDQQGLPFVGAAGKFLNEMLATIGLKRDDVYITNIVKYRPPENRDPLPEEKEAFLPYLQRQLAAIKPKLIVTLGRHSMECFLPGLKISQVHGNPKRIKQARLARIGNSGADAMQGAGEKGKGAVQDGTATAHRSQATQQRAASNSSADSSAVGQADATWVILPLYHPAAALYNGAMRQLLIEDFAKIPAILNKIESK